MAQAKAPQHVRLTFGTPNLSIPASDRAPLTMPPYSQEVEEDLVLHDARTYSDITQGPAGLDVQGFTFIKHRSALQNSEQWFAGRNVEDIYFPEVCDLVCEVTGAKRAVVNYSAFRRRLAEGQAKGKGFYYPKGGEYERELKKSTSADGAFVYGKEEAGSLEPARKAHIDYTLEGLRRTVRQCRADIREMAKETLDAEDARAKGEVLDVPRYAAYSVWRPVKTVRRDPLAVCDCRSLDKADLVRVDYRALSDCTEDGEYLNEAWSVMPPKEPEKMRWCWMPEQQPDEVLILKLADTAVEEDPRIAGGCPHGSPIVPGTEDEEARWSIEVRVLAFW